MYNVTVAQRQMYTVKKIVHSYYYDYDYGCYNFIIVQWCDYKNVCLRGVFRVCYVVRGKSRLLQSVKGLI